MSQILETERPRLGTRLPAAVELKVVADDKVARGGCIIETAIARLDAQLSHQLDALEKALGERGRGPERHFSAGAPAGRELGWAVLRQDPPGDAPLIELGEALSALDAINPLRISGRVTEVTGLVIKATVPGVRVGEMVHHRDPAPAPARRGGRLPGRRGDADAPGRAVGIGPDARSSPPASRSPSSAARACSAACSVAWASPSTARPARRRDRGLGGRSRRARSAEAPPRRSSPLPLGVRGIERCSPWARASAWASSPAPASASRR